MWRYGLALAFTALAFVGRMALDPALHNNYVFPTFFLANWLCGLGPTLLTIVLGLELSDCFFIPPRHQFFAYEPDQWIGLASYLVVSGVLAWYGSANRRAQAQLAAEVRQRQQTEERLQQARNALAESNKHLEQMVGERTGELQATVAELHHFSYALALDLRAPLRAMNSYLFLVRRGESLSQTHRDLLGRVMLASEHLDALITDALNYSRAALGALPLEPVDPALVLSSVLDTYPNLNAEHAEVEIARELPALLGNRAALVQCFSNLLGNAVKFSKPGVKPRIRVWAEHRVGAAVAGPAPAGAPASAPAQWERIWVEDNGIGIPQDLQPRLFGMFQRLHGSYEGTGIGLAIVRKVVERMGGRVGVESEEGRGSRFWVELRPAPTG